jgi:putative ABC transport system substrate-binding protein
MNSKLKTEKLRLTVLLQAKFSARSLIATVLLALCSTAQAQPATAARIGVLLQGGPWYEAVEGLRAGLKELGLEEGKQFFLDIRDSKGDLKAIGEAARDLERERAKIIYAIASSVVDTTKKATSEVPIVFNVGSDPVASGLVDSFAKPGGRLTGVHFLVRDLTGKRLEIFKELVPKLRTVLTIYNPTTKVSTQSAEMAREEAKRLGLKFVERHVSSVDELRAVLHRLKIGEADAFFYTPDSMVGSQSQLIIDTAKAKKLATMFQEQALVTKGALASYGQNYHGLGRLSAKYVQKILAGTPPRDMRIETIDDVELVVNLATAKYLGLTIPPEILARAHKVIR